MRLCRNSEACDEINLGSDHRALWAEFGTHAKVPKPKSGRTLHARSPKWPPDSVEHYLAELEQLASNVRLSLCLEDKCAAIEAALIEAMHASKQLGPVEKM